MANSDRRAWAELQSVRAAQQQLRRQREALDEVDRGDDADKWLSQHDPALAHARGEAAARRRRAKRRITEGASAT